MAGVGGSRVSTGGSSGVMGGGAKQAEQNERRAALLRIVARTAFCRDLDKRSRRGAWRWRQLADGGGIRQYGLWYLRAWAYS